MPENDERDRARAAIREMVDRETGAWDTQDADLLVSIFHPDMVWPWPPTAEAHDPMEWVLELGRYDAARWRAVWQGLFDSHTLVRNRRVTRRIEASAEGDGGFAVVDIDTLWRDAAGNDFHWLGRTCKIYTKLADGEWRLIAHHGVLNFPHT